MADTEQPEVATEPQSRHVIYCGGTSNAPSDAAIVPHVLTPLNYSLHSTAGGRPTHFPSDVRLRSLTIAQVVLRIWRDRQEVPRMARRQPPGHVQQDLVRRFVARLPLNVPKQQLNPRPRRSPRSRDRVAIRRCAEASRKGRAEESCKGRGRPGEAGRQARQQRHHH